MGLPVLQAAAEGARLRNDGARLDHFDELILMDPVPEPRTGGDRLLAEDAKVRIVVQRSGPMIINILGMLQQVDR